MPKPDKRPKATPPKTSSGGGFVFENDVAAFYLLSLLAGRLPFGPAFGAVQKVSFQTAAEGWLLDDILLTTGTDGMHRIALSVKDRPVLSNAAILSDIADRCWRQLLHDGSDAFNEENDFLGLVIGDYDQKLATELCELVELASKKPTEELAMLLDTPGTASKQKRNLWASFACPRDMAEKYRVSENDTGKLLARFRLISFDFGRLPSNSEAEALKICADTLENPSPEAAAALWETMRSIADEARPRAGSHSLTTLLRDVRPRHELRQYPFHEKDWRQLSNHTESVLKGVEDAIGGRIHLRREAEVTNITNKLGESRVVALLGPSGGGKTVLSKACAENGSGHPLIWLPATLLKTPTLAQVENGLKLKHSFADLLPAVSAPVATLVVDGVDRLLSDEAFANLRALLKCLNLQDEKSPWRVLLTCTPAEWVRIQRNLLTLGLPSPWTLILVEEVREPELEPVWKEFPSLCRIDIEPRLRVLRANLKVLDLLARGLVSSKALETERWVGESDIVAWFWDGLVKRPPDGFKRAAFIQQLAQSQADDKRNEMPLSEFNVSDLDVLEGIVRDQLCTMEDERLGFAHELYGDWARQRVLLGNGPELRRFLEGRAISPLWHAAIRLLALHLLEQNESPDRWQETFEAFGGTDGSAKAVQDLFLDAVYVSSNSRTLLDKVWPLLELDGGSLLRGILTRFMYVGTTPNPLAISMALSLDEDFETLAATHGRIPYWPYWPPMLQFLASRASRVTDLAPKQVALICDTWLRSTPTGSPLRLEASQMAVTIAERVRRQKSDIWT